jgi:hypothetical protein
LHEAGKCHPLRQWFEMNSDSRINSARGADEP